MPNQLSNWPPKICSDKEERKGHFDAAFQLLLAMKT